MAYVFDPLQGTAPFPNHSNALYPGELGMWVRGPDLLRPRYYPTATLTRAWSSGAETVLVLGGEQVVTSAPLPANPNQDLTVGNSTWNTYEVLRIGAPPGAPGSNQSGLTLDPIMGPIGSQQPITGPGAPMPPTAPFPDPYDDWLYYYPRAHLLTTGDVVFSGFARLSSRVDPATSVWSTVGHTQPVGGWSDMRWYGASLVFPNTGPGLDDVIMRMGGGNNRTATATGTTEILHAAQPNAAWLQAPSMNYSRGAFNAVILPDASILAIGGVSPVIGHVPPLPPVMKCELFAGGKWTVMGSMQQSPRQYHSTAMLLPDGRVLSAGSDDRSIDYEVFEPGYLQIAGVFGGPAPRPENIQITGLPRNPSLQAWIAPASAPFSVTCNPLPLGVKLAKAVLMAPGSTTHHSDMCQRYTEAVFVNGSAPNQATFRMPAASAMPRGFYMLFLMTNTGLPSVAEWVQFQ